MGCPTASCSENFDKRFLHACEENCSEGVMKVERDNALIQRNQGVDRAKKNRAEMRLGS
jgi:hypothetical protein